MDFYSSKIYRQDLEHAVNQVTALEDLAEKSVMVTGASGLIGSYVIDMLMTANRLFNLNITVYALGRNRDRLDKRFHRIKTDRLVYVEQDVNQALTMDCPADYLIYAASNAYPAAFVKDPVGTMMSNIAGTKALLEYGRNHGCKRFLFVSSGEIYGQGDLSLEEYTEDYQGYVDILQPRSCYPVSKRAAETLCCAYTKQYGLDTVIVRPCHTYGPNTTEKDNRATVQFVNNVLQGENIVLKSAGSQMRSYCYVADCATALLTVLLHGKSQEAYNIANPAARVTIAEFARIAAQQSGCEVVYEDPDQAAIEEQTPIAKQVLSSKNWKIWDGKPGIV